MQPLKFFVQKSCLDMHIIVHKFKNNWFIHFKNCICDYLYPKIAYLSPYKTHISKIIFICIKNCHHRVNHHCWNVQIWFYISALAPLWCVWVLPQHLSIRYFGLRSDIATNVELLIWKNSDFWNNFWLCLIMLGSN